MQGYFRKVLGALDLLGSEGDEYVRRERLAGFKICLAAKEYAGADHCVRASTYSPIYDPMPLLSLRDERGSRELLALRRIAIARGVPIPSDNNPFSQLVRPYDELPFSSLIENVCLAEGFVAGPRPSAMELKLRTASEWPRFIGRDPAIVTAVDMAFSEHVIERLLGHELLRLNEHPFARNILRAIEVKRDPTLLAAMRNFAQTAFEKLESDRYSTRLGGYSPPTFPIGEKISQCVRTLNTQLRVKHSLFSNLAKLRGADELGIDLRRTKAYVDVCKFAVSGESNPTVLKVCAGIPPEKHRLAALLLASDEYWDLLPERYKIFVSTANHSGPLAKSIAAAVALIKVQPLEEAKFEVLYSRFLARRKKETVLPPKFDNLRLQRSTLSSGRGGSEEIVDLRLAGDGESVEVRQVNFRVTASNRNERIVLNVRELDQRPAPVIIYDLSKWLCQYPLDTAELLKLQIYTDTLNERFGRYPHIIFALDGVIFRELEPKTVSKLAAQPYRFFCELHQTTFAIHDWYRRTILEQGHAQKTSLDVNFNSAPAILASEDLLRIVKKKPAIFGILYGDNKNATQREFFRIGARMHLL